MFQIYAFLHFTFSEIEVYFIMVSTKSDFLTFLVHKMIVVLRIHDILELIKKIVYCGD